MNTRYIGTSSAGHLFQRINVRLWHITEQELLASDFIATGVRAKA